MTPDTVAELEPITILHGPERGQQCPRSSPAEQKGPAKSLAAIPPPSFDLTAGFSRIARGIHACKENSVG